MKIPSRGHIQKQTNRFSFFFSPHTVFMILHLTFAWYEHENRTTRILIFMSCITWIYVYIRQKCPHSRHDCDLNSSSYLHLLKRVAIVHRKCLVFSKLRYLTDFNQYIKKKNDCQLSIASDKSYLIHCLAAGAFAMHFLEMHSTRMPNASSILDIICSLVYN